ncbi:competence protein ComEA helix-hairpin-helix repeat region [delta proteobacterium NaphS2]|nr:competence protein ComEA helix-hairpin-helix repeat region [delta proteobacterium NaphS2]
MTKKWMTLLLSMLVTISFSAGALAEDKKGKLNINKATVEELAKLPGMTQEIAEGIVELRKERGEFVDMSELLDVEGVDNRLLRKLEPLITIEKVSGCNC